MSVEDEVREARGSLESMTATNESYADKVLFLRGQVLQLQQALAAEQTAHQKTKNLLAKRERDLLAAAQDRRIDPLTGIGNRVAYDEALRSEWSRMMRAGKPLATFVFDLDHFKRVNDTLGHAGGDEALTKVAHVLEKTLSRVGETVARFGGDEFAAIVPWTTPADALAEMQRLQTAVRDAKVPAGTNGEIIGISIGAASVLPTLGKDPKSLFEGADRALYKAKETRGSAVLEHTDGSFEAIAAQERARDGRHLTLVETPEPTPVDVESEIDLLPQVALDIEAPPQSPGIDRAGGRGGR